MSFFKDVLHKEALTVFLNTEEFAELMLINGQEVPAQWDDTLQPLGEKSATDPTGWGVVSETPILFVLEEGFACPLPDEELDINGERYTVLKANPQMGVIRLELERKTA